MTEAKIGIVGGSGFYNMDSITVLGEEEIETPFGDPSNVYTVGELHNRKVAFLARHGEGHTIPPHEINFRANIYGFKKLGVEWLIAPGAVGSLKENIHPLDFVITDQFYDRTKKRIDTFFNTGIAAHIPFGDPVCPSLKELAYKTASKKLDIDIHSGGTYVCIEGPQFSTRAESEIYRQLDCEIVGMTALQEAKLAREAEICYLNIALVTDYDCWYEEEVSVDQILENMSKNTENAKTLISELVKRLDGDRECMCESALETNILTSPEDIPERLKNQLKPMIGKYI